MSQRFKPNTIYRVGSLTRNISDAIEWWDEETTEYYEGELERNHAILNHPKFSEKMTFSDLKEKLWGEFSECIGGFYLVYSLTSFKTDWKGSPSWLLPVVMYTNFEFEEFDPFRGASCAEELAIVYGK